MLVATRPLAPQQLIAATEINLSTSPDHTTPESSLDAELVVHVCGGLVLLDQELQVMRFAHLSVQEYLETRDDSWGIIDAQRFVSEGCLWTLQRGPSLMPALYDYAGRNWFRHCRSYQDLAELQTTQDPNDVLDIPRLNAFLGSFDCASTHFVEWVDWSTENQRPDDIDVYNILSRPLRPIFAAAVCGLGELVSWLWHSKGADMNIRNDRNDSLLHLASKHGTAWIIKCVLARGAGFDMNEICNLVTPLWGAVHSGIIAKVALLLDHGADVNFIFGGDCGTALEKAAAGGNLEMTTFLLDRGAEINLTLPSSWGTALLAASYWGNLEVAMLLLGRGAKVNLTSSGKYATALVAASAHGKLEMVMFLLDSGADINLTSSGAYGTALDAAAAGGRMEIVSLLLDRGANPNLTNHLGQKPREVAALWGYDDIVRLLEPENYMTRIPVDEPQRT